VAVSLVAQMLISAAMAASSPADAAPAKTCGSPIFDPAHDCKVREDGAVQVKCTALRDGSLTDCSVVSETPPGKGFGAAALGSASRAHAKADDSRPESGAPVVFMVRFKAGQ
jgi:hypothetical protein